MERKRYVHCEQTGRTRRRSGRQSRRGTSRRAPGSRCGRTGLVATEGMGAARPRCGRAGAPGLRPRAAGEDSRCGRPFSFSFSFPLSESVLLLCSKRRRPTPSLFPSLVLNPRCPQPDVSQREVRRADSPTPRAASARFPREPISSARFPHAPISSAHPPPHQIAARRSTC